MSDQDRMQSGSQEKGTPDDTFANEQRSRENRAALASAYLDRLARERDYANSVSERLQTIPTVVGARDNIKALASEVYRNDLSTPYTLEKVYKKHRDVEREAYRKSPLLSKVTRTQPDRKAEDFACAEARNTKNAYFVAKVLSKTADPHEEAFTTLQRTARCNALAVTDTVWQNREGTWAPRSGSEAEGFVVFRDASVVVEPTEAHRAFIPHHDRIHAQANTEYAVARRSELRQDRRTSAAESVASLPRIDDDIRPPRFSMAVQPSEKNYWDSQLATGRPSGSETTQSATASSSRGNRLSRGT